MPQKKLPDESVMILAIGSRHIAWRKNLLFLLLGMLLLSINLGAIGGLLFAGWSPPPVFWLGLSLAMLGCLVLPGWRLWRLGQRQIR